MASATIGREQTELAQKLLGNDHEHISVHDFDRVGGGSPEEEGGVDAVADAQGNLKLVTPVKLSHSYLVVREDEKLNTLFSFLKAHRTNKVLVFFSACKQVRFAYEAFSQLRLGITLLELHGR